MCSTVVRDSLAEMTISQAMARFSVAGVGPRDMAEIAFALAVYCHQRENTDGARAWIQRSISLFKELNIRKESECSPRHPRIAGIDLPDPIHDGVAEFYVASWGIDLAVSAA